MLSGELPQQLGGSSTALVKRKGLVRVQLAAFSTNSHECTRMKNRLATEITEATEIDQTSNSYLHSSVASVISVVNISLIRVHSCEFVETNGSVAQRPSAGLISPRVLVRIQPSPTEVARASCLFRDSSTGRTPGSEPGGWRFKSSSLGCDRNWIGIGRPPPGGVAAGRLRSRSSTGQSAAL